MRIHTLQLEQFRNYALQSIALPTSGIHIFLGPNGSGKTNVLEAVSILSLGKSCRGTEEGDLVRWDQSHYRLKAELENDAGDRLRLECVSELTPRRRRAAFLNDVRIPPATLVGTLPTVIFLPQDLELFSGPPAERRRFLDQLLSQSDRSYVPAFHVYQKVLKQRHALLRQIAEGVQAPAALDPWDRELAQQGAVITAARLRLLESLDQRFARALVGLGEALGDTALRTARKTQGHSPGEIASELQSLLLEARPRDIALQSTSVGPHREDWQIIADGRALPTFASRGQERVAVVALLLLEIEELRTRCHERPVVLFDDVFSELDDAHQEALLGQLTDCQVLMTSVRVPPGVGEATIWRMREGEWTMNNDQ